MPCSKAIETVCRLKAGDPKEVNAVKKKAYLFVQ
jgi:hypothetical protein